MVDTRGALRGGPSAAAAAPCRWTAAHGAAMRRIGLVLGALLVLGDANLQAQALTLGTEAGVSVTQLASPGRHWDSHTGPLVGASLSASFTPWLAVQAGLRLHEKGAAGPWGYEIRILYLEFPLLVRVGVGSEDWRVRPLGTFGLAPATELSCNEQVYVVPLSLDAASPAFTPTDCTDVRTDHFDLGVVAGGGVEVRLGGLRAAAVGQYTRGTHNIASGLGFSVYNRATSIVLSVSWPLWDRRPARR